MNVNLASLFVDSWCPICYRLIRRNDGNGNMLTILQGHFLFTNNSGNIGREWRDLETLDDPTSAEDDVPFSFE